MENGEAFSAPFFADTSYEGDLMAQAGISYTWGRESTAQYGESLAGARAETPFHQFQADVAPGGIEGVHDRGEAGSADRKVQAYNFRLILTREPANQAPWYAPANYDPARWDAMARYLELLPGKLGRELRLGDVVSIGPIPNGKADFNNNGAISTDYIGMSWEYPNAGYRRREEIWRDHEEYTREFLRFLTRDSRVPAGLQKEANEWGPAKDEFADNGNFPNQLYIREARRMIGEYVMTQGDIQTAITKPDPIGMGSYASDSHNVQRIVNGAGFLRNEGDVQVQVTPYQIPYRVLLPKKAEAENLLVPVCLSASHVAYSTLRMEPQYMMIGQAAGVAAALAKRSGRAVQDIDTAELTRVLVRQGAILEYVPSRQNAVISLFPR